MKNHKAFTLVELMVIISVIGILSSFVIVQMNGAINSGKDTQRKADIGLLANALVQYSSDHYNSKVATDIDGCQIGGTTDKCSTDIENSLKSYLPTLPDDPNADASYTYQSNGSDCTISATLSDGTVYQYACDTQLATTGTPIDGECGSAAGDYDDDLVAFTTTNYCAFGDPEPITPVFPTERGTEVTWQCPGQYLGDPKACYARRGKDGACGTAQRLENNALSPNELFSSTDYCAAGTASPVTPTSDPIQGSSSTWDCSPIYTGTTTTCFAYRGKNGECGTSNGGNYYSTAEINSANPCATGTVTDLAGSGNATGYFTWTCPHVYSGYTGTDARCSANLKVNGVCNSTTTSTSYAIAAPPTNLCTSGIATTLQQGSTSNPTGYWTWNCTGSNDGLSPSCAADLKVVNGVCNATTTNPTNGYTTAAPPTDLCTSGTASTLIQGSASNPTGYWTWNCAGSSGGTNSACTANLKINGVCGTANKNYYTYSPSTYGSDTFCASGTLSNTPVFPTSAAQTWYCNGSYGGTNATCKSHYCVEDKSAWPANWSSKCSEAGGTMVDYDVNHYACPGLVATWRTQCGGGSGLGGSVPYYYYSKDINAGKTATFAGYYISNLCGFFHWGSGKVSAMAPDEGFWTTLTNPDGTTTPYFANIVTPGVQRIWVCN